LKLDMYVVGGNHRLVRALEDINSERGGQDLPF